jgi:hypothetical protein
MKKIFLCIALAVSSTFWGTSVVVASVAARCQQDTEIGDNLRKIKKTMVAATTAIADKCARAYSHYHLDGGTQAGRVSLPEECAMAHLCTNIFHQWFELQRYFGIPIPQELEQFLPETTAVHRITIEQARNSYTALLQHLLNWHDLFSHVTEAARLFYGSSYHLFMSEDDIDAQKLIDYLERTCSLIFALPVWYLPPSNFRA